MNKKILSSFVLDLTSEKHNVEHYNLSLYLQQAILWWSYCCQQVPKLLREEKFKSRIYLKSTTAS